jgi:excinuclease UvrABC nuclease subunit
MRSRLTKRKRLNDANLVSVPARSGVYVLFGAAGSVVYVGASASLRRRLAEELRTGRVPARSFAFRATDDVARARRLERELVTEREPRFNAD